MFGLRNSLWVVSARAVKVHREPAVKGCSRKKIHVKDTVVVSMPNKIYVKDTIAVPIY